MSVRRLVAVVDDDESVRESLPDLLRQLGFDVEAFSSGPEFLNSDDPSRADALVIDVSMPLMDGFELQRHLRQRGILTPVVLITSHADAAIKSRARSEGASACLFKPFSRSVLLEALEAAISKGDDRQ
jgi:FixJ family two-component response regulator